MTGERLNAVLSVGDRVCLWLAVAAAIGVLSALALRADRDPPSLISPVCVTTPSKAGKP